MEKVIDNKQYCKLCLDWTEFQDGEASDYPCNGCCMAEAEYAGDREPRLSRRLSVVQVAELTGAVGGSKWVSNCISQVEGGSNDITGACGLYCITSMASAMAGSYSELYEIEHDGLRRCALVKL